MRTTRFSEHRLSCPHVPARGSRLSFAMCAGFDKAVEVRSKPLQLLATFARLSPSTALTPCRLCLGRSASTVRLWPRPTATTHRPLDARPCTDHACIVCAGMSRYGVNPNMLILPPQMLLYMVRLALTPRTNPARALLVQC